MVELRRWTPLSLSSLHKEINDLFRKTFEEMGKFTPAFWRESWYPVVDCFVKEGKFRVRVELPGIEPKDIDLSVVGDKLIIKGTRRPYEEVREEDYLMKELYYGSFERTITLPEGVVTDKIHATYKNGILEISMPCESAKLPRKISIEIEEERKKAA